MDFNYTVEQEAFRAELRAWLDAEKAAGSFGDINTTSLDAYVEHGRRWQKRLYDAGWCGLHWPAQYGGRGIGVIEQIIFQEELGRVGSPQLVNLLALSMVGPLIIEQGSEAQKKRYLRSILDASEIWCQGYSEPGAGSDLAAIKTKAIRDGDEFVVNGQKVWTSYAQYAEFCILLVRTDPESKKHRGLTLMILDMKSSGIDVRPLRQMNGDSEFNEVYLDDVRIPVENVIGNEGAGWQMAISLLMHERATLTFQRQLQSRVAFNEMLQFAREFDARGSAPADDPITRQCLAQAYIESEAMRLTATRHLTDRMKREDPPGPEGSMEKLFWSEMYQRMLEIPMSMSGAYAMLDGEDARAPLGGRWPHLYMYSRGRTIAAGTSEVQRGIIAQRVLGLPKDR
jgi:alkylation response protein AidB-like acyl-CoA dehydrogenase